MLRSPKWRWMKFILIQTEAYENFKYLSISSPYEAAKKSHKIRRIEIKICRIFDGRYYWKHCIPNPMGRIQLNAWFLDCFGVSLLKTCWNCQWPLLKLNRMHDFGLFLCQLVKNFNSYFIYSELWIGLAGIVLLLLFSVYESFHFLSIHLIAK